MGRLTQTPTFTSTYQSALPQRGPAAVGYTPGPDKKKKGGGLMKLLGQIIEVASVAGPMLKGKPKMMPSGDKLKPGMGRMPSTAIDPNPNRHFNPGTKIPKSTGVSNKTDWVKSPTKNLSSLDKMNISKGFGAASAALGGSNPSLMINKLGSIGKKSFLSVLSNKKEDE